MAGDNWDKWPIFPENDLSVSLLPKGSNLVRTAIALARADGRLPEAPIIAGELYGVESIPARILRAAVAAGSLEPDETWGSELGVAQSVAQEFVGLVEQSTIVGRMSGLRRVPLNTRTATQTAGTSAGWVGEGAPIGVGALAFEGGTLTPMKLAVITVVTDELLRSSGGIAEASIRADLVRSVAEASDVSFIDPASADVSGIKPASITYGLAPISATASAATDMAKLVGEFEGDLMSAYLVTSPKVAARLAVTTDVSGASLFPDVGVRGGSILGVPLIVSRSVPAGLIVLIDASGVLIADGGITIDHSRQASVQMDSAPSTGAQALVSLWQQNLHGLLALRLINWRRARAGSVAYISGASY